MMDWFGRGGWAKIRHEGDDVEDGKMHTVQ